MRVVLVGYGQMGHMLEDMIARNDSISIMAVIDVHNISDLDTLERADVVMDFSAPAALAHVSAYVRRTGTALVSGTTGYTPAEIESVKALSAFAPVIYSTNYSLGVMIQKHIAALMAQMLPDFEIEIVETHHHRKADAPSGTAISLAAAMDPDNAMARRYGREGRPGPRPPREIGFHSVRGGTEAGTHQVFFFGEDEKLELAHSATSRRIFAYGALKVANELAHMGNGFYTVEEVLLKEE